VGDEYVRICIGWSTGHCNGCENWYRGYEREGEFVECYFKKGFVPSVSLDEIRNRRFDLIKK